MASLAKEAAMGPSAGPALPPALAQARATAATVGVGGGSEAKGKADLTKLSASDLFYKGKELFDDVEEGREGAADGHGEAMRVFRACKAAVARLQLLSANETIDDVATTSIKYLALDFYLGRLLVKSNTTNPRKRMTNLQAAREHHLAFLRRCRDAKILQGTELKVFEGLQRVADAESEGGGGGGGGGGSGAGPRAGARAGGRRMMTSPDGIEPALRRQLKIEHYKREKEERAKERELAKRRRKRREEEGAKKSGKSGDADDLLESGGRDDEEERELGLLWAAIATRGSISDLNSVAQEMQMLRFMQQRDPEAFAGERKGGRGEAEGARRLPPQRKEGPGLQVTHIGPGFEVRRETVRAGVFRPSHILPTYTPEQAAEMEMAETARREAEKKERIEELREAGVDVEALGMDGGVKSLAVLHRDGLEEDETLYDRATRKARDWDDWKDDHTKGYGDTKKF